MFRFVRGVTTRITENEVVGLGKAGENDAVVAWNASETRDVLRSSRITASEPFGTAHTMSSSVNRTFGKQQASLRDACKKNLYVDGTKK
mmetsp:Transcript_449/g.863  ORF Transcript_449/g.863 Transcript_449/m.863 type:complete len:89 (-) Transcript_449:203-469(-)